MPRSNAVLLFFVFLLISSQSGIIQGIKHGKDPITEPPLEVSSSESARMKARKLLEEMVQVDYDYAGPNPKHNPRRGGSKNP